MLDNEYILFLRIWNSIWQARMYSSQIKPREIPLRRVVGGLPPGVLLQIFHVVNADDMPYPGRTLPMSEQGRFTRAYPTQEASKWQWLFWGNFSLTENFSHLRRCVRFLLPNYPSGCLSFHRCQTCIMIWRHLWLLLAPDVFLPFTLLHVEFHIGIWVSKDPNWDNIPYPQ